MKTSIQHSRLQVAVQLVGDGSWTESSYNKTEQVRIRTIRLAEYVMQVVASRKLQPGQVSRSGHTVANFIVLAGFTERGGGDEA